MTKYYSPLELAAGVKIGSNDEVTIEMGQPSDTYAGVDGVVTSKQNFHIIVDSDNDGNEIGGFTIRSGGLTVDTSTELLKVAPNGVITVKSAYALPIVDGTSGQQLTTNGAGQTSWAANASAITPFKYNREWHISPDLGSDTLGDGSEEKPYATVAKVKSVIGVQTGHAIYLHVGSYTENVNWNIGNTDFITMLDGGTVNITGNWTFSHTGAGSVRVWNGGFNGTVAVTGTGPTFFTSTNLNGAFTKSGSGYVELRLAAEVNAATSTISITGAGQFMMHGGAANFVTINNASATFVSRGSNIAVINLQAGTALVDTAFVYSATATTASVTSAAGTFFYGYNSHFVTATGTLSRVNLAGYWSMNDCQYDKVNSTLSGINLSTLSHFDTIQSQGSIITTPKTVATLGSAAVVGARSFVTDANETAFGTAVTGGGANKVPVYSNGISWMIG